MAGRELGRVKSWVHHSGGEKPGGFGFAWRKSTGELVFIHRKELRGWPKVRSLEEGALIEFGIVPPAEGATTARREPAYARAKDVVVLKPPKRDAAKYLPGEKVGAITSDEAFKIRQGVREGA